MAPVGHVVVHLSCGHSGAVLGPKLCAGKSAVGGVVLVPKLNVIVGITVVNHFILVNVIPCGCGHFDHVCWGAGQQSDW